MKTEPRQKFFILDLGDRIAVDQSVDPKMVYRESLRAR
jgi:hypothetical protein